MKLTEKFRPANLGEIRGNAGVKKAIGRLIENKNIGGRCILFAGNSGCGKTSLARIIANEIGKNIFNVEQINGADVNNDYVDRLRTLVNLRTMTGDTRVLIIDEAHRITKSAQEKLLTILEDLPNHNVIVFTTTEPAGFTSAFIGRCLYFKLDKPSVKDLQEFITEIAIKEGESGLNGKAFRIAELASQTKEGNSTGYRGALQLFETLLLSGDITEGNFTAKLAE